MKRRASVLATSVQDISKGRIARSVPERGEIEISHTSSEIESSSKVVSTGTERRRKDVGTGVRWTGIRALRLHDGVLSFADEPTFTPNLTPAEVLQRGSFGGGYFRNIFSSITGQSYTDTWKELPEEWISGLSVPLDIASPSYRKERNTFGVKSGQDLAAWESSGWIIAQDPYGWFMWYCRFFQGRRSPDDDRQIGRWKGVAGATGRWKNNLIAKVVMSGRKFDDPSISPVVRQTLQHWAYSLTQADFMAGAAAYRISGKAPFIASASNGSEKTSEKS